MPPVPTPHSRRELVKAAVLFGLIPVALLGGSTWTFTSGSSLPLVAAVAYVLGGGIAGVIALIRGLDATPRVQLPRAQLRR